MVVITAHVSSSPRPLQMCVSSCWPVQWLLQCCRQYLWLLLAPPVTKPNLSDWTVKRNLALEAPARWTGWLIILWFTGFSHHAEWCDMLMFSKFTIKKWTVINWWLIVGLAWWFGIGIRIPLSNNPFQWGDPIGIQTNRPQTNNN